MNNFEWSDAATLDQAVSQLDNRTEIKAGGVDLLDLLKERLIAPKRVVNIRNIRDLDYITYDPADGLKIGPLATLAQIANNADVQKHYPSIATAAIRIATPQIRNMATIGGNLLQRPRCWYFRSEEFHCRKKGGLQCFAQDGQNQYHAIFKNDTCAIVHPSGMAVPLVALGASIERMNRAARHTIRLEEFFITPDEDVTRENKLGTSEILTEIQVPAQPATARNAYIKQGEKESFDWPIADVAVVIDRDGERCRSASIVLGAAAPIPWRAKGAEAALVGQTLNDQTIAAAAQAAVVDATPLALNGYKIPVFQAIVRRTIQAALA